MSDLKGLGWRVCVVWECALRLRNDMAVARTIGRWLKSGDRSLVLPEEKEMRRTETVISATTKLELLRLG